LISVKESLDKVFEVIRVITGSVTEFNIPGASSFVENFRFFVLPLFFICHFCWPLHFWLFEWGFEHHKLINDNTDRPPIWHQSIWLLFYDRLRVLTALAMAALQDEKAALAAQLAGQTGGITAKRWGRIGDTPIIGAGTWADGVCAVSATGSGEYFIRAGVCHQIAARIALAGEAPAQAATTALAEVAKMGGSGGVIVDKAASKVDRMRPPEVCLDENYQVHCVREQYK
jgi:hypothetical protein